MHGSGRSSLTAYLTAITRSIALNFARRGRNATLHELHEDTPDPAPTLEERLLGGRLCSGIDAILDAVRFDDMLIGTDMVISGVAERCKAKGVPLVVLAGVIGDGISEVYSSGVSAVFCTNRAARPSSELLRHCESDYTSALGDILRLMNAVHGEAIRN